MEETDVLDILHHPPSLLTRKFGALALPPPRTRRLPALPRPRHRATGTLALLMRILAEMRDHIVGRVARDSMDVMGARRPERWKVGPDGVAEAGGGGAAALRGPSKAWKKRDQRALRIFELHQQWNSLAELKVNEIGKLFDTCCGSSLASSYAASDARP